MDVAPQFSLNKNRSCGCAHFSASLLSSLARAFSHCVSIFSFLLRGVDVGHRQRVAPNRRYAEISWKYVPRTNQLGGTLHAWLLLRYFLGCERLVVPSCVAANMLACVVGALRCRCVFALTLYYICLCVCVCVCVCTSGRRNTAAAIASKRTLQHPQLPMELY